MRGPNYDGDQRRHLGRSRPVTWFTVVQAVPAASSSTVPVRGPGAGDPFWRRDAARTRRRGRLRYVVEPATVSSIVRFTFLLGRVLKMRSVAVPGHSNEFTTDGFR